MDSAERINNELKYLNKLLQSNKIRIHACKTKYMLFTYNINVNLQLSRYSTLKLMKLLLLIFTVYTSWQKIEYCKLYKWNIFESCEVNLTFI